MHQIRYFIIAILLFSLSGCTNQKGKIEKPKLEVKHVFINGLPNVEVGFYPDVRHDYYYVYNYMDDDYSHLEKMLDTLFIDTSYWSHSHIFYQYNEGLPDTMDLNKGMADSYYRLQADPASADYYDDLIVQFTYIEGYFYNADEFEEEKVIPDNYVIATYKNGEREKRYFLKDSLNGPLVEVDRSVVAVPRRK